MRQGALTKANRELNLLKNLEKPVVREVEVWPSFSKYFWVQIGLQV